MKTLTTLFLIGFLTTACNRSESTGVERGPSSAGESAIVAENNESAEDQMLQIELFRTFNEVDARLDSAEDSIEEIASEIESMNGQIGQITGEQIASFQTEVDASLQVINGKIAANETSISTINEELGSVQTAMGALQSNVDTQIQSQNALVTNQINEAQEALSSSAEQASEALSQSVDQRLQENASQMQELSNSVNTQIEESESAINEVNESLSRVKVIRNYGNTFSENYMCGAISGQQFFMHTTGSMKNVLLNLNNLNSSASSFNLPGSHYENAGERENWIVEVKVFKGEDLIHSEQIHYSAIPSTGYSLEGVESDINPGDVVTITAQLDIGESVTEHDYTNEGHVRFDGASGDSIDEKWSHCIGGRDEYHVWPHWTRKVLVVNFDLESTQFEQE